MNLKNGVRFGVILLVALIFTSFNLSASSVYCCERTVTNELCKEVTQQSECNLQYAAQHTSCNQTAFCKIGTCVDNVEGMCLPNTPLATCTSEQGGNWYDKSPSEIGQCSYGCCFFGDQSAFVTQIRCGTLASLYQLNTSFHPEITNELTCLSSAGEKEKGACVFVENDVRNCRMLTKAECNSLEGNKQYSFVQFSAGYLCTAGFLDTVCKPLGGTTLVNGKFGIYFKDTCGNIANIYDYSNIDLTNLKNKDYWTKIYSEDDSCGFEDSNGNVNSKTCGNCNPFYGSMGEEYVKGENTKPNYGNYVCGDLGCTYDSNRDGKIDPQTETYKNNEKWCLTNNNMSSVKMGYVADKLANSRYFTQSSKNLASNIFMNVTVPGTEQYLMKCYNGKVLMESCTTGNYRNKICVSEETDGFSNAACVANVWTDCLEQSSKEDCLNTEIRDCKWIEGYSLLKDEKGKAIAKDDDGKIGTCVPKYTPADTSTCQFMNDITVITYDVKWTNRQIKDMDGNNLKDRKKRFEYCYKKSNEAGQCDASDASPNHVNWLKPRMEICAAIGDCTSSTNYLGTYGEDNPEDLVVYKFVKKQKDVEGEIEEMIGGETA